MIARTTMTVIDYTESYKDQHWIMRRQWYRLYAPISSRIRNHMANIAQILYMRRRTYTWRKRQQIKFETVMNVFDDDILVSCEF